MKINKKLVKGLGCGDWKENIALENFKIYICAKIYRCRSLKIGIKNCLGNLYSSPLPGF